MTIDTAKELQMNIAKEGLALLMLHPSSGLNEPSDGVIYSS